MNPPNHRLLAKETGYWIRHLKNRALGDCYGTIGNSWIDRHHNRRTLDSIPVLAIVGIILALNTATPTAWADWFGTGENTFKIEFVTIGDPGNPADTTGDPNPAGSVPYIYRIGKYEISEQMITKADAASAEAGEPLGITTDNRGPDKPATSVSWFNAARFVNWLNTSTGNTPAYKFDENGDFQLWEPGDPGYDPNNLFRNRDAYYFLPSADEWYKAAFYDPVTDIWYDYPNGSNEPPIPVASGTDPGTAIYNQAGPADIMLAGGPSPYGTVAQAGNVWEWEETAVDLVNDDPLENRGFRGDNWGTITVIFTDLSSSGRNKIRPPDSAGSERGFRVASIPEPCSLWLLVLGLFVILSRRNSIIKKSKLCAS